MIHEPLEHYRDELKEAHAKHTADFFEDLLNRSGVDRVANEGINLVVDELKQRVASKKSRKKIWSWLHYIVIAMIVVASAIVLDKMLIWIFESYSGFIDAPDWLVASSVAAIVFLFLAVANTGSNIGELDAKIGELNSKLNALISDIYNELTPFNSLFTWDTIPNLVMKTAPQFKLDRFMSEARLEEFIDYYDFNVGFNDDSSIEFCQSGDLNGNPFVFAQKLNYWMGTTTYTGTKFITWQELEDETYTDSDGRTQTRSVWVTKSEVLYAYLDKPAPKYNRDIFLLYGHEAAPDLYFTRIPSALSKEGVLRDIKLRFKISSLNRKSKKLGGYTIMSNQKFDALFGAVDRNNDHQFRLLFTPLAQQEMLQLLEDDEVGYGDSFSFSKEGKLNIIRTKELNNFNFSASPHLFWNYNIKKAREFFNRYSNEYFRIFFFAFAPLLAIPLYQNRPSFRKTRNPYKENISSFWQHEAIANSYLNNGIAHPESVTYNIVKTRKINDEVIEATAYGFRTVEHTDYVPVRGGDGYLHDVAVDWLEYIPVSKTTQIVIKEPTNIDDERESWSDFFHRWARDPSEVFNLNSIVSFLRS